jgi:hypothetical protein
MPGFLGGSTSGGGLSGEIRYPAEFIDPVTKIRVSEPQNLIDTDFEYGLQPTKWETVELINNTPSFFSASGDTTIANLLDIITTAGSREVKVTTSLAHGLAVGIPINVNGSKSLTADGAYIINSVPDSTTFTYLCKQNQLVTASIVDLYTSIVTGQFFQGSQIKIADSEGIVTNAQGQSTLTIKTDSPHGFGVATPFYFLNLNSTISQEFDSSNTASKTFDASNSATAQSFDGSNTLTSYAFDLNNKPVSGGVASSITNVSTNDDTITVLHTSENFVGKQIGTPLYYAVSASSGYFATNPRGVVYLASTSNLGSAASTFQVSTTPGGSVLDLTVAFTGSFQLANTVALFAGNNTDLTNQTIINLDPGTPRTFDGANNTGSLSTVNSFSNGSDIIQIVNDAGSTVTTALYVGAMVQYTTTGTAAGGLTNNETYWVTYYNEVIQGVPGLVQIKVTGTIGTNPIIITSQGSGTHKFRKIGVSTTKDIVNIQSHGFVNGDLIRYTYPAGGAITRAAFIKDYMFVTRLDDHNFQIESDLGIQATGGTVSTVNIGGTNYKVHEFKVTASPAITDATYTFTVSSGNGVADFLVIGGGGAGGQYVGGGGGAGRFAEGTMQLTAGTTYNITVGGGGRRSANGLLGSRDGDWRDGNVSSIIGGGITISCPGGGRGGNYPDNGQGSANNGGSGGGAGAFQGGGGVGGQPVAATLTGVLTGASYGFKGGDNQGSRPNNDCEGRGGGGAGGAGVTAYGAEPSDGGIGRQSSITGTTYYYAGGGGGGGYYPADYGSSRVGNGGQGGGGGGGAHANGTVGTGGTGGPTNGEAGSRDGEGPGGNAANHTGSGGGGCGHSQVGGNGGSGYVVIRYRA